MNNDNTKTLNVGLVGSGFMGRCHANAFRTYGGLFEAPVSLRLHTLADGNQEQADRGARALGFAHATGDWRTLVADPAIDIVSITAPNALHEEIALAAIAQGKTIYCEKPLSISSQSALRMTEAAEAAGVATQVGFNFLRNPLLAVCKELIESGELGEIVSFRGRHAENYMADPELSHSFRTDPRGGGAMADIGSHIISMARYLLGDISEVSARSRTVHSSRPLHPGAVERGPVEVDDLGQALVQFSSGVQGTIEANWMATGRNMDLSFEITGTHGAVAFSQERMNELHLWEAGQRPGFDGFKKLETGPAHPPYGNFCPAPGHHIGFNDLKVIEVAQLVDRLMHDRPLFTDFREGYRVQCTVDAIQRSAADRVWTPVEGR